MRSSKKYGFKTGAAAGAAVVLALGGGYFAAARAEATAGRAVNAPATIAPATEPSFADLVSKVAPAVVSIDVVMKPNPVSLGSQMQPFQFRFGPGGGGQDNPFSFNFGGPAQPQGPERAAGSGFFISSDGYIATNNHVVDGAQKITVETSDGRSLPATVVGRDPATDLAVIRVNGGPFPYVSFENRAQPRVGDWVVAVGNPFGLGGTATAGIVSALDRQNVSGSNYVDYMQIDAPINHGNSGGPTFDVEGHVVGVNTAIFSPSGGSVGIGFDIPADVAARVTQQLIAHGSVTRGYIGSTIQTLSPDLAESLGMHAVKGALVDQLTPDGPAAQAGLRSGDVIETVEGRPVDNASAVTRAVGLAHPGDTIVLGVLRDGAVRDIQIRAAARPSETALAAATGPSGGQGDNGPGALGMRLAPDPDGGLLVEGVDPNSDAASKGLQQGDVILRVGTQRVQSSADVMAAAAAARHEGRASVPLLIARGGAHIFVPVRVPGAG